MKDYLRERAVETSNYVIQTGATVRETAKKFGVSKSTVHKDITERLQSINSNLYQQVQIVLEKHKQERHLRGGYATKKKYAKLRQKELND